jgi:hypothetical protein
VFAKVKNGQKKCPIFENPGIFGKQDFPEMHFTPKCSQCQIFHPKSITINF